MARDDEQLVPLLALVTTSLSIVLPSHPQATAELTRAKFHLIAGDKKPNDSHDRTNYPRGSAGRASKMSLRERVPPQYQNGEAIRAPENESDAEEEALVNDYREQVQYDGMEDLDRIPSGMGSQDIQAQLQAAATPLEFQATLETK